MFNGFIPEMRIHDFLTLGSLFLMMNLISQNKDTTRIKTKIQYGFDVQGIGYNFNFNEMHKIQYFFNLPKNLALTWPRRNIMVGRKIRYYYSLGVSLGFYQISRGAYQYHEQVKAYCSTSLFNFNIHRNLVHKHRVNVDMSLGICFAKTTLNSINELYYTAPNDTVQFFFSGKLKQNWISNFALSVFFPVRKDESRKADASIGFAAGYNFGLTNGIIDQSEGEPLSPLPSFSYSGPFVSFIMLNVWSLENQK